MTRKMALQKALEVLTDKEAVEKIYEILEDMPFARWSEKTIFDTVDQFVVDNGRNPTTTDFLPKGMPPHPVIKLRFGLTLGEFLKKYYPQPELFFDSRQFGHKPKEAWLSSFIKEYNQIKPRGAYDYDSRRSDGLPCWSTVAKMYDITKWLDWLNYCQLEKSSPVYKKRQRNVKLIISSHIDLIDGEE